jgi:hypothetical protein
MVRTGARPLIVEHCQLRAIWVSGFRDWRPEIDGSYVAFRVLGALMPLKIAVALMRVH